MIEHKKIDVGTHSHRASKRKQKETRDSVSFAESVQDKHNICSDDRRKKEVTCELFQREQTNNTEHRWKETNSTAV